MCKIKNVEDLFLKDTTNVYHFFPSNMKDNILRNGLLCSKDRCSKSSERKGIYVIWYDDERVKSAIAETQVSALFNGTIANELSLFTINLKKYGILAADIAPDLNGAGVPDINSFCCKIIKDITNIDHNDITKWEGGNSDTYGITYYNLEGYNIAHKPLDFDSFVENKIYAPIVWKEYK